MKPGRAPADRNFPALALTMGEPAGIGGEITIMSWLRRGDGVPPFFVIDDPGRLERLARRIGMEAPIQPLGAPEEAGEVFPSAIPVLPLELAAEPVPGEPCVANGASVRTAIERAVALVADRRALALVTNPIHKGSLYRAGFPHPGHTEFLADLAKIPSPAVMMLACPELRVVPVTVHRGLGEAIRQLSSGLIVHVCRVTDAALRRDFGVVRPRLAISGLNPHAGEGATMGTEERDVIEPAIARLRDGGMDAQGPFAADSMFAARARNSYDVAICMYHDQALIPIKTLDFDGAVNVTLGLPFVRTSPDHGTALDIAGSGQASPASLISALRLAADLAHARAVADAA